MPTFQGLVSEEQLNALVAYVKSQSQPGAGVTKANAAVTTPQGAPGKGNQVQ
jgi:mono/diheme cytochrome c family protein